MGRDKALLPYRGRTLVEHVAMVVKQVSGSVTLVGAADRYLELGYRVIEDRNRGCGPLSGIEAALQQTDAEWNAIVACDMPNVDAEFLLRLFELAEGDGGDIWLAENTEGRVEPLYAVYNRRCLAEAQAAIASGQYKVTEAFRKCRMKSVLVPDARILMNMNTPEEWQGAVETGND